MLETSEYPGICGLFVVELCEVIDSHVGSVFFSLREYLLCKRCRVG